MDITEATVSPGIVATLYTEGNDNASKVDLFKIEEDGADIDFATLVRQVNALTAQQEEISAKLTVLCKKMDWIESTWVQVFVKTVAAECLLFLPTVPQRRNTWRYASLTASVQSSLEAFHAFPALYQKCPDELVVLTIFSRRTSTFSMAQITKKRRRLLHADDQPPHGISDVSGASKRGHLESIVSNDSSAFSKYSRPLRREFIIHHSCAFSKYSKPLRREVRRKN